MLMTIVVMIILGIETSCDETAAAVIEGQSPASAKAMAGEDKIEVLSNVVASQIEIHKKYGGVVPEVAAREHVLNILPVVNEALVKAGITPSNFPLARWTNKVDAIAVTVGPGLVTSLLVGVETAKILAYAWRAPVVAVNHIEGHIYANFIGENFKSQAPNSKQISNPKLQIPNKIKFPAIILTVSGGHTMLILMSGHGKYKVLGETRDDAAGEAFDKAAQLLGLGYPGGPAIAAAAANFLNKSKISLPRPMINSGDYDFSFSGLKTALFYQLRRDAKWQAKISEYAAEFQKAAVEVLVAKTIKAAKALNSKTVMLAGGVAANLELRERLKKAVKDKLAGARLIIPELKYCTDNAAMIAAAGYYRARREDFMPWQKLKTEPNKELI